MRHGGVAKKGFMFGVFGNARDIGPLGQPPMSNDPISLLLERRHEVQVRGAIRKFLPSRSPHHQVGDGLPDAEFRLLRRADRPTLCALRPMPNALAKCGHSDIAPIRLGLALEEFPAEPDTINLPVAEDEAWIGLVLQDEGGRRRLANAFWWNRRLTPQHKLCANPAILQDSRSHMNIGSRPSIKIVIVAPDKAVVVRFNQLGGAVWSPWGQDCCPRCTKKSQGTDAAVVEPPRDDHEALITDVAGVRSVLSSPKGGHAEHEDTHQGDASQPCG